MCTDHPKVYFEFINYNKIETRSIYMSHPKIYLNLINYNKREAQSMSMGHPKIYLMLINNNKTWNKIRYVNPHSFLLNSHINHIFHKFLGLAISLTSFSFLTIPLRGFIKNGQWKIPSRIQYLLMWNSNIPVVLS